MRGGQRRGRAGRSRTAGALVAWLVAFALLAPLATGSGPAAADATLTISPATDLVDGQVVTGQLTGLSGAGYVLVAQCPSGSVDWTDCWLLFGTDVGTDGTAVAAGDVRTVLPTAGGDVDCRDADACEAVAWVLDDEGQTTSLVGRTPLHFDPAGPLIPPATLEVEPSTGLVDGQSVLVRGTGFGTNEVRFLRQCVPASLGYGCRYSWAMVSADAAGAFTAHVMVRALLRAYRPDGSETTVDCRTVADPCVLAAFHDRGDATVALRFDPAGPLLPAPVLTADPSVRIAEGATVQLRGSGFDPSRPVFVSLCRTGTDLCDGTGDADLQVDVDGRVHGAVDLSGSFDAYSFDTGAEVPVDCRVAPFCELRAEWGDDEVPVTVPVRFSRPAPTPRRYVDPVFADVDVTRDLVYRSTFDVQGRAVDLHLDIYQPRGDTARRRPAVLWMHGGYFIFGDRDQLASQAIASAQRGYVGITLQYRLRPGIAFDDWAAMAEAAHDAHDDAVAALGWLRDHASTYRIDRRALVVAGYSAGGVMAWNLAYTPANWADPGRIAASIPMAGLPFAAPDRHAPPVIAFHAADDEVLSVGPARDTCAAAAAVDAVCEWVEYPAGGHLFGLSRTRSISVRAYDFLRRQVLAPLGYLSAEDVPDVDEPTRQLPPGPTRPRRPLVGAGS